MTGVIVAVFPVKGLSTFSLNNWGKRKAGFSFQEIYIGLLGDAQTGQVGLGF
jgi:hypothetical protein